MASLTKYYGLGFFDFGDPLGTDFAGQIEIDRWLFLDKQIYGMMTIFGNGVISGWTVAASGAFTLSVSEGHGNLNWMSGRTEFPFTIENFPPSSIRYVYAKILRSTAYSEEVTFMLSSNSNIDDPNYLLLAKVVSGPTTIEVIDNSVRDVIDFIELIREAIRDHKHRGGSLNPSKIDLSSEVKGQLPAFRIADFDAEKITTGTFDLARLPLIDHSELANVGLLTHPQLDTFVKTLEATNKELFGEIGTANLLQLIIALKLIYDDPSSTYYLSGQSPDENMINELVVIPGVTPNERIDFENSTAEINLTGHYIQGLAGTVGTAFYVRWENELAWLSAYAMENLAIVGDSVTMSFNEDDQQNVFMIENFDEDPTGGFEQDILIFKDGEFIKGTDDDDPTGGQTGEFDPGAEFRLIYVKTFDDPQDWSQYENFLLDVKTLSTSHTGVRMFFADATGAGDIEAIFSGTMDTTHFTEDSILLEPGTSTYNPNPLMNDYETRTVDIGTIPFRDAVKAVVLWTDSLSGGFTFRLNDMRLTRSILLPESGLLKLRYATSSSVRYSRIEFLSDEPEGTEIRVRARAANGTVLLNRAVYTRSFESGTQIDLDGTDLEIEITFLPNANRTIAPVLEWVRVLIITDAEIDGFAINTQSEFIRGTPDNIDITDSTLSIDPPIYVDSYYLAMSNKVVQIHEDTSTDPSHTDGELAVFGVKAPIAPNQIFRAIEAEESIVSESNMYFPRSVYRMPNKSFVIADTYNDRILHLDEDGDLIEGFGSINYTANSVFPMSACVDVRQDILFIVWSASIPFQNVNMNRFLIKYAGQRIPLLQGYDLINNKLPDDLTGTDRGQVMSIYLSDGNKSLVKQLPATGASISISADAVSSIINENSIYYQMATNADGSLPIFIGNFWYTDVNAPTNVPIFAPTYAEKTTEETYIFTNSKVGVKPYKFPTTDEPVSVNEETNSFPSIVEVDPEEYSQATTFTSNFVDYSPFIPGIATKLDNNTILAAGLLPTGEADEVSEDDFNFRTIVGNDEEKEAQKTTLDTLFFGKGEDGYIGAVRTISTFTSGGAEIFKYNSASGLLCSDAQVDSQGNIVVAESTFVGRSGRVIKLDTGGNIVFSYGEGLYSLINDIRVQSDDSIVISS